METWYVIYVLKYRLKNNICKFSYNIVCNLLHQKNRISTASSVVTGEGLGEKINIHNHACTYTVMLNKFAENPEATLSWLGVSRKRSCSKKLRLRKNGRTCSQKRASLVRISTIYISPDYFIYFSILYSIPATS